MYEIKYLTDDLLNFPGIKHGFFTRQGGVSCDEFASLNVSKSSGDVPENVDENRRRVAEAMGFQKSQLVLNKQIHSNKAVFVDGTVDDNVNVEADGLVTTQPRLLLGVMGADCPPVLFCDPQHKVIGAAHAGWPGAKAGVLESTVDLMIKHGAVLDQIRTVIGPSIDQKAYEIDQNFYDSFMADNKDNASLFVPSMRDHHYMFDLKGYCKKRLQKKGVTQIVDLAIDTYTDATRFFSNRRRFHMGEERFGVTVNVIGIV